MVNQKFAAAIFLNILVTGGAGFLGSHLVDRLIAEGYAVTVMDNLSTGQRENLEHVADRIEFVEQDCCEHWEAPHRFGAIFHLASPASPADFDRLPIEILRVCSEGTRRMLELAKSHDATFILASTSEVYGDPLVTPQPETYWGNVNPIGVRSVYDEGKRFAEALTMAFHRRYQCDTRIARFFNTYGPRMRLDDGRVVPNFIAQALAGAPLTIYGSGEQTRSFCYVDDTVGGLIKLWQSDCTDPVNLGSEEERTVIDFADRILKLVKVPGRLVFLDAAPDDPRRRRADISRARQVLNWEPKVTLEQGLERTIEYFRAQLD